MQDLATSGGSWHGWTAKHVWSLWTRYACAAFYSHPWAWNEIGFSGPAYPRGYLNPGINAREQWEVADQNHDADPIRPRVRAGGRRADDVDRNPRPMTRLTAIRPQRSAWLIPNEVAGQSPTARRTCAATTRRRGRRGHRRRRRRGRDPGPATGPGRLEQVVLDAGPFWNPDTDWVSDERGVARAVLD